VIFDFETCARMGVLLIMFILAMALFGPSKED